MELLSPADSDLPIGESAEHPMHVGALQLFTHPPGPDGFVTSYEQVTASPTSRRCSASVRRRCSAVSPTSAGRSTTTSTSAITSGGRRCPHPKPDPYLFGLISRLRQLLDRHHPLWGPRHRGACRRTVAVYKMHHSLVDGGVGAQAHHAGAVGRSDDTEPVGAVGAAGEDLKRPAEEGPDYCGRSPERWDPLRAWPLDGQTRQCGADRPAD